MIEAGRFELLVDVLALRVFAFLLGNDRLLLFALRFPEFEFELSLAFLFAGFFLGLFSFAAAFWLVPRASDFSSGFFSGATTSDDSPSLTDLLMSMATVWPTFTTSPARGS
jgi:hypothetical protein